MAKKKTVEVSEEVVSQVENGSVETTTDNVEPSVTETKTEEPPKEELSETDKVNQEIAEDSDEAEEEAKSYDETTANLNEEIAEKEDVSEKEKPSNVSERFFKFDKKEAKRIYVDKTKFLSVVFYKRLIVGIKFSEVDKVQSLVDFGAIVYNNIEALIKSLRFDDVDYQAFHIDEVKNRNGFDVGIISIDVPFTDKTPLFISKVRKLVDEAFPECYVRSSSNCRTMIDTTKTSPEGSLLKGFTSFATYTRKKDDVLKVTTRSGAFIQSSLGYDNKDIGDLNRYILASTKLNAVSEKGISHKQKDGSELFDPIMNYFQTMRSKICGMIFEVTDMDNGKYYVERTQYYVRICTRKVIDSIIPSSVKVVSTNLDPIWTNNLEEIFTWKDPKNKSGFLGNDDIIGTDPNVINLFDDMSQIQSNILDNLSEEEIDDDEEISETK